ncbi:MAG: citrate/2-methylcitrate synthase [Steroidobacteraceae bacterium]
MNTPPDIRKGLEDVIVDTTAVSLVEGDIGRLTYRGYAVEGLLTRTFADAVYLIVFGELPNAAQRDQVEEFLWQAGSLPTAIQAIVTQMAGTSAHPMEILQGITPMLALDSAALVTNDLAAQDAETRAGLIIAARIPTVLGVIQALRQQRAFAYPSVKRYGARYLQLLTGKQPTAAAVDTFERTQILQLDHSFNASTFTARVVTSTISPVSSGLSAAMGALYGVLHGRADQAALEMAQTVGSPEAAAAYVAECLASKKVVMGMGHREYRVVDPRAKVIKGLAENMELTADQQRLFNTLVAVETAFVEQTSHRARAMRANLEFYKGLVYLGLGLQKDYFTASFAAARAFGWLAHINEQRKDNRIIRPDAHYIGPGLREVPAV